VVVVVDALGVGRAPEEGALCGHFGVRVGRF